jgi:hypothetical protein
MLVVGAAVSASAQMNMADMARFGGPVYTGAPALGVTASIVKAGGGPGHFSTAKAITTIVGPDLTKGEVTKLSKQYSKARIDRFLMVFDYAIADSLKIATAAGVKLPAGTMMGKPLGEALVKAGMAKDGTFYTELLLDKAVSHKIHMQVMDDIEKKWGVDVDKDYHRIANQAYYDLGVAYKIPGVKLAKLH